jgi:hypothetical protein
MAERRPIPNLDPILNEPPRITLVRDDGSLTHEYLVMVGWAAVPPWKKEKLEFHGIDLTYARYHAATGRFEPCLFSLEVVATLEALKAEGGMDFEYCARLSEAGGRWVEAKATGRKAAPQPLSRYLVGEGESRER